MRCTDPLLAQSCADSAGVGLDNATTLNSTSDDELKNRVLFVIASPTAASTALAPFITLNLVKRLHAIISLLKPEERGGMKVQEVLAMTMGNVSGAPVALGDAETVGNDAYKQVLKLEITAEKALTNFRKAASRARKKDRPIPISRVAAVWESLYRPNYGGAPSTFPDGTIITLMAVPYTRDLELTRLSTTISRATKERNAANELAASSKQAALDEQRQARQHRNTSERAEKGHPIPSEPIPSCPIRSHPVRSDPISFNPI